MAPIIHNLAECQVELTDRMCWVADGLVGENFFPNPLKDQGHSGHSILMAFPEFQKQILQPGFLSKY